MIRALLALALIMFALPAHALQISEITSPRGITLWFVKDATTPTITVSFAFRGGTETDPAAKQGRAFLTAAALTEGTAEMDADIFQQVLDDRNISLGFSAGRESIGGNLRYLTRYEETALDLAEDAIMRPAFRDDDVQRLKAQMNAGIKMQEADPDFRAARLTMQQVFAGHAYGQAARGTPTTIKNISAADLRAFRSSAFVRARLLVVVVGDTTAAHAGTVVDKLFAELPKGSKTPVTPTTRQGVGHVWYSPWAASEQNSISFTAPAVDIKDADYPAALILNDLVAAGGFRAMLMDRLRQTLGATYGISAGMQQMDALSFTMGSTSVEQQSTDAAIDLIRTSWGEVRSVPFDDDAIDISRNYLQSSFSRDLTSSKALAGYVLGLRMARLPRDYADVLTKQLAAVTEDDLARVAARLYNPQQLSFVVVGPAVPNAKDRTIKDIWTLKE